jgi:hypothetical protein
VAGARRMLEKAIDEYLALGFRRRADWPLDAGPVGAVGEARNHACSGLAHGDKAVSVVQRQLVARPNQVPSLVVALRSRRATLLNGGQPVAARACPLARGSAAAAEPARPPAATRVVVEREVVPGSVSTTPRPNRSSPP